MTKIINEIVTSRRQLLKASATAVGGLSVGLILPGCNSFRANEIDSSGAWQANAWIEILPDNSVIFTLDRVEMGQGTYTGLTTILAEELDIKPSEVSVVFAPAQAHYRNPEYNVQITGGSNSMSSSWQPIREAGASIREMILLAAAEVLQVPVNYLKTDNAHVIHQGSTKKLSYGSLTRIAATQTIPSEPKLKEKSQYKYIGKQNTRLDSLQKTTGKAVYGIDVDIPNMKYAVVTRAPMIGGKLKSHNGSEILKLKGVLNVVEISSGLSIVASTYWQARKAQEQLKVEWETEDKAPISTAFIKKHYQESANEDSGDVKRSDGDISASFKTADKTIEVEFDAPFLAHATMEPMNCTADIRDGKANIWTSTQAPAIAQVAVAKVTDVSLADVVIHNQFIGGGFGRRLNQDFVAEAAEISFKSGEVVKLLWSREEDTKHDLYRPAALHKISAALDPSGMPLAWDHQIVAPKILDWVVWDFAPALFPWAPKFMYPVLGKVGLLTEGTPLTPADESPYEGADNMPYNIPAIQVRHTKSDAGVPISYWRSVGHSHNAFVVESFIDELAFAAKKDAYQFRRGLLNKHPRLKKVLDSVSQAGNWGKNAAEGVFQGIAVHESFNTYVAQLVEIEVNNNEISVLKVYCAVDCGLVVNPDIVVMQMESSIIFGITAALYGEITIEDGMVQQSNFHDYPLLRINQTPKIETVIVESSESPTGVGEPGLPPIAPAIANALFKATGKRHRSLPFKLS